MNATENSLQKTFSFKAPYARNVLLAGDFTHWLAHPIPLEKKEDGVVRATTSLAPGTYHYRFYVDDEWCEDPQCQVRVRNPFGTMNNVIQVFGPKRASISPETGSTVASGGTQEVSVRGTSFE